MTTSPINTAALDIARGIQHDQRINPTWSPTRDQIERRVRNYCDEGDPNNPLDRDRILTILIFIFIDN